MKIQTIVSDMRSRVETAGKQYQGVLKAYVSAQREALTVVTRNGQTLANTEIGAAKNVFAAARASFDKARKDGVRKVASNPQAYVPNGRDQIVSAYKDAINLLLKAGNELTGVVSNGYKSVLGQLSSNGAPAPAQKARAAKTTKTTEKSKETKTTTAKRKTAAKRSTTAAQGTTARKSSARKAATGAPKASKSTTTKRTPTKRTAKTASSQPSAKAASGSPRTAGEENASAGSTDSTSQTES